MALSKDVWKNQLEFLDVFGRIAMEQKLMPADLKEKYGKKVPYDVFFPSQQDMVEKRVCTMCGMYFSSVKSITAQHRKICKIPRKRRAITGKNKSTKAKKALIDDPAEDEQEPIEEPGSDETEALALEELDASFEDEQNNQDFDNIEEVNMEATISVPSDGGFDLILDLKQWLKSPWNKVTE